MQEEEEMLVVSMHRADWQCHRVARHRVLSGNVLYSKENSGLEGKEARREGGDRILRVRVA